MVTLADFQEFLDKEIKELSNLAERKPFWFDKQSFNCSLDRALGVAFFVQKWLEFPAVDAMYNEYKEKVEEICKNFLTNSR